MEGIQSINQTMSQAFSMTMDDEMGMDDEEIFASQVLMTARPDRQGHQHSSSQPSLPSLSSLSSSQSLRRLPYSFYLSAATSIFTTLKGEKEGEEKEKEKGGIILNIGLIKKVVVKVVQFSSEFADLLTNAETRTLFCLLRQVSR